VKGTFEKDCRGQDLSAGLATVESGDRWEENDEEELGETKESGG